MNTTGLLTHLESAVANQVMLAGNDPAVDRAAQAIISVLEPALQQAALDLAQQAAQEVEAQLGDQRFRGMDRAATAQAVGTHEIGCRQQPVRVGQRVVWD